MVLDITCGPVDNLQRRFVAGPIVIAPGAHAVMAQEHTLRTRVLFNQRFDEQADIKAGTLPWNVDHIVAIDLPAEPFLMHRRRNRDHRVRVQVVDMTVWNESVQWSINRTCPRIEIEDTVTIEGVHPILCCGLCTTFRMAEVKPLHRPDLIEIQSCEAVTRGSS